MTTAKKQRIPILWAFLAVIAALGIGKIVYDAASEKDVATHWKFLLPAIFLGWLWVLWTLQPNLPRRLGSVSEWKKKKATASALLVLLSGLAGMGGIVQLVSPQAADKYDVTKMIDLLTEIIGLLKNLSSPPNVARLKIVGLWGEGSTACTGNTFRFQITGDTLVLSGVRQPPASTKNFKLDAKIQPADPKLPNVLAITVMGASGPDGRRDVGAATFTYLRNGKSEEMIWDDAEDYDPRRLFKCTKG